MRSLTPLPLDEAKASVLAWAKDKGIPARVERGWIILDMADREPDPVLELMTDVLNHSLQN